MPYWMRMDCLGPSSSNNQVDKMISLGKASQSLSSANSNLAAEMGVSPGLDKNDLDIVANEFSICQQRSNH